MDSCHGFVSWIPVVDLCHGFVSWIRVEIVSWIRVVDSCRGLVSWIFVVDLGRGLVSSFGHVSWTCVADLWGHMYWMCTLVIFYLKILNVSLMILDLS